MGEAIVQKLSEQGKAIDCIINLVVPHEILEERICGRWIHKPSGRSYHTKFNPPKSMRRGPDGKVDAASMNDDETGDSLMQRPDDTAAALITRLKSYHDKTT